jgi:hypothetical protein
MQGGNADAKNRSELVWTVSNVIEVRNLADTR